MRVIMCHQHDPGLTHVGGIETFINTFVKYAPQDVEVSLVGVTADPAARPVGRWQRLRVGDRDVEFLPIAAGHPRRRTRVPLSLRFTWALARHRAVVDVEGAILTFHRIEPALAWRAVPAPKVLFHHLHMEDLYNPKTESAWRVAPWLYFWLERQLIDGMSRIFCVREDAAASYRKRYPALAGRITFVPTWVDEDVFDSWPEQVRRVERRQLARRFGFDPNSRLLLFVGRFEGQKDPLLLLEAFRRLNGLAAATRLVMIGEGSLEPDIRAFVDSHGLAESVLLPGPQPQAEIVRWMNAADCLCLSSAYEGMPIVVLEALRCGLPVVATATGETPRLLAGNRVGVLVHERSPEAFGQALTTLLQRPPDRRACQQQVAPFGARQIVGQLIAAYRELDERDS